VTILCFLAVETPREGEDARQEVLQVAAGEYHSAVVTRSGYLYTWGYGANGRLGLGTNRDSFKPCRVKGDLVDEKVVHVSLGESHTVCITALGALWTWGCGRQGRLGHNTEEDLELPRRVYRRLQDVAVVEAAAGFLHTVCVSRDGHVYTWGFNGNGRLGQTGTAVGATCLAPNLLGNLRAVVEEDPVALAAKEAAENAKKEEEEAEQERRQALNDKLAEAEATWWKDNNELETKRKALWFFQEILTGLNLPVRLDLWRQGSIYVDAQRLGLSASTIAPDSSKPAAQTEDRKSKAVTQTAVVEQEAPRASSFLRTKPGQPTGPTEAESAESPATTTPVPGETEGMVQSPGGTWSSGIFIPDPPAASTDT